MNSSLAQALATVLNIQVTAIPEPLQPEDRPRRQAFVLGSQLVGQHLGYCDSITLDQAVCRAVIEMDLKRPSSFAIFPIGSGRENIYMAIERELLRQEQALGGRMWEKLGNDPRELVTLIMEQLREAAVAVINPTTFQIAILRTCCLLIACMTWISDWIARLKMKAATMQQQRQQGSVPPPTNMDDLPDREAGVRITLDTPPPVPLFGAGGVGAIHVVPDPASIETRLDNEQTRAEDRQAEQEEAKAAADEIFYICPMCNAKIHDMDIPIGEPCPNCDKPRA